MRLARPLLLVVALLAAGCRGDARRGAPDAGGPLDAWPEQAKARWPRGCLIENVAVHPTRPWLAAACTPADVLVFDFEKGTLRRVTPVVGAGQFVGWSETPDAMRWSPDGTRLSVSAGTNGIAVLPAGPASEIVYPDDTRDSAVRHVWIDGRIFTDTGAVIDGGSLESTGAPPFEELEWNTAIRAVVGRVHRGLAAFDPIGRRVVYQVPMTELPGGYRMHHSRGGRSWVRRHLNGPDPDELLFFDGDTGRLVSSVAPSLPRTDDAAWSADGSLFVVAVRGGYDRSTGRYLERHLDLFRRGQLVKTIDLTPRDTVNNRAIPEGSGLAPSPPGDAVAVLLDNQEVQVRDAATGDLRATFRAPAPAIPAGLPDYYKEEVGALLWLSPNRIVRLAPHFVSFWTPDGKKLAELVVPGR